VLARGATPGPPTRVRWHKSSSDAC
jgi:hypothetical protein